MPRDSAYVDYNENYEKARYYSENYSHYDLLFSQNLYTRSVFAIESLLIFNFQSYVLLTRPQ